ncbi:MAG TPA: pyrroline-5-carboxylate reductase [Bacillales bacterium]|nr:pyrroline-5-carboxylate reductase [Bacillales bacterium]
MNENTPRVLFIGAGRMAEAIFAGLIHNNDAHKKNIMISNRSNGQKLMELEERYGVRSTRQWQDAVSEADVILLAMPPEAHPEVLAELDALVDGQFIVTVAAGIGPTQLEAALPAGTPTAWVMPNTAADIGESISLYTYGKAVDDHHRQMLEVILAAIGDSQECTEEQIHKLTAITGSAPAFIYFIAENLEEAAMQYGIDRKQAKKLVTQMIYGSGAMLKNGGEAADLRQQVTSPGGATAAGLEVLTEHQLPEILKEAVSAVNARAAEQAKS